MKSKMISGTFDLKDGVMDITEERVREELYKIDVATGRINPSPTAGFSWLKLLLIVMTIIIFIGYPLMYMYATNNPLLFKILQLL